MRTNLTKNVVFVLCLIAAPVTALKVYEIYPGRIINGQPADATKFPDIVKIRTSGAGCTATLVGPRVILTAAHCGRTGQTSVFTMDGQERKAKITRSDIYPGKDHDMAVGLLDVAIRNVKPRQIGKDSPNTGDTLTHYGYGCTKPGGGGGNDGVLRYGDAKVTGTSGYDIISKGAGLCYGDSGGPTLNVNEEVISVNSKGNIQDINYTVNLAGTASKSFLTKYATDNGVEICGVNKDCSAQPAESFKLSNEVCSMEVVKDTKSSMDIDYMKTMAQYLMNYYKDNKAGPTQMIKKGTAELPPGFCDCGLGWMSACDSDGEGQCGPFHQCYCSN